MDFNNYVNHIKLFFLVAKLGADVFVKTLKLLYNGSQPIEHHLVELANKKSNGLNKDQKDMLEKLKLKEVGLKHLDITLTYKLIQLACNLEPKVDSLGNACVWSNRCPKEKENCLEQLLFQFKTKRNHIAHNLSSSDSITDQVFEHRKAEIVDNLTAIIDKVGEKAKISDQEIKSWKSQILEETKMFSLHLSFATTRNQPPPPPPTLSIIKRARFGAPVISPMSSRGHTDQYNNINDFRYAIVNAFKEATDLEQPLEKSNRIYWIKKLTSLDTLENPGKMKQFWKEYEYDVTSSD